MNLSSLRLFTAILLLIVPAACSREEPSPAAGAAPESFAARIAQERAGRESPPPRPVPAPGTILAPPSSTRLGKLDLAAAPRTTDISRLIDLVERQSPGSGHFAFRSGVTRIQHPGEPWTTEVFILPGGQSFYIRRDAVASSTRTYYGPFTGDPYEQLEIPRPSQ